MPLEYQTLLVASGQNESAPETGAPPNFKRSEPQAATLVGLTSKSLLELVFGIARGFIASGISRTRSTCRSPFSRLAPLTLIEGGEYASITELAKAEKVNQSYACRMLRLTLLAPFIVTNILDGRHADALMLRP